MATFRGQISGEQSSENIERDGELCEVVLLYRFHKQGHTSSSGTSATDYHQYQEVEKNFLQAVFILKKALHRLDGNHLFFGGQNARDSGSEGRRLCKIL